MTYFTVKVYEFFQKHKLIFWIVLLLSSAFFVYFGSKIRYEEDVTKLLPSSDEDNSTGVVFENLKVKDKMFLVFKPKNDSVDVERTVSAVDTFMSYLENNTTASEMLDESLYKLDPSMLKQGLEEAYGSIPTFLDSSDYNLIEKLTTKEAINQQMQENLMTLYSPAGSMMMGVIQNDPLALRNVFINKMSSIKEGLGSNYKIIDNHFFSPDSAIAIAWLSPNFITFNSKLSSKLISEIDLEIEKYEKIFPDIDIYYHGAAPQAMFNSKQVKSDLIMTLSISFLIIFSIFLLSYRSPKMIIQMALPIGYGFFFALAIIYFIKGQISLLALGIGAIVLGVSLSYCLHIIIHQKHVEDPVRMLKEQTIPVILGSMTTIGAFISLLFTRAELLQDFGIFAALSLIGTTLFCLIFLPHFFGKKSTKPSDKAMEIIQKINGYPFERKTFLIVGLTLLSIICIFSSNYVKFDANLKHISHYEPRVMESQRILAEHTTKDYQTVYFASTAENLDSALVLNRNISNTFEALEELGKIGPYKSSSDQIFILQSEQEKRIQKWHDFWTPEKRKQVIDDLNSAAVACGFSPDSFYTFKNLIEKEDFKPISLYDSNILPNALKYNMIEKTDGKYLVFSPILIKEENKKEVCDEITSHKGCVVIDPFYYTSDMLELIHQDFDVTLGISSIFVLIVLLIAYKSLTLALISFLPMTISWYIVLGMMAIFGIEFNLINIIISSLIYGVGVDYSIFVMDGLLSDYRTKKNLLMFHKTAIIFSAMTLIITVTSLLFATHPSIYSIGTSTLIGMSFAVLISYTIQPFLFYWLIKRQAAKGKAPITVFNILHGEIYFNKRKEMSNKQQIRNIFEYKGYEVEKEIKKELKETHNYSIFNELFDEPIIQSGKMLDFYCSYGCLSYWFHINTKEMTVIGYDKKEYPIEIATNCYSKDQRIKFTNNEEILDYDYDLVAIKNCEKSQSEKLNKCLNSAKYVIILNKNKALIEELCPALSEFKEETSDNVYTLLKKNLK